MEKTKISDYEKEPWVEDKFGTQPFSNFKQVPKESFERAMVCVNACAGYDNPEDMRTKAEAYDKLINIVWLYLMDGR